MSILKGHIRKTEANDKAFYFRLPSRLFNDFQKHCDSLGVDVSEALRLLMKSELSGAPEPADGPASSIPAAAPADLIPAKQQKKPVTAKNGGGSRFKKTPWEREINGTICVPCPLCGKWPSSKNFARHAKEHDGKTSEEILTMPEAAAMVDKFDFDKGLESLTENYDNTPKNLADR